MKLRKCGYIAAGNIWKRKCSYLCQITSYSGTYACSQLLHNPIYGLICSIMRFVTFDPQRCHASHYGANQATWYIHTHPWTPTCVQPTHHLKLCVHLSLVTYNCVTYSSVTSSYAYVSLQYLSHPIMCPTEIPVTSNPVPHSSVTSNSVPHLYTCHLNTVPHSSLTSNSVPHSSVTLTLYHTHIPVTCHL